MNKSDIPYYEESSIFEAHDAFGKRQPPHIMSYGDSEGHSLKLYLCCFCNDLPDLTLKSRCEHFQLLSGSECPYFTQVSDTVQRINQLIAAKEDSRCGSSRI